MSKPILARGFDTTPPTSAPNVESDRAIGGLANSSYQYVITYINWYGETTAGPATSVIIPARGSILLTNIPLHPRNYGARAIYRTGAGLAGPFRRVAVINDVITTSYTDILPDSSLGQPVPSVNFASSIEYEEGWNANTRPIIHPVNFTILAAGNNQATAAPIGQFCEIAYVNTPTPTAGVLLPPVTADMIGMKITVKNINGVNTLRVYAFDPAGGIEGGGPGSFLPILPGSVTDFIVESTTNWREIVTGGLTGVGGTVTIVNTGAGLTGGPITTVGIISLAPNAVVLDANALPTTYPTDLTKGVWYGLNTRAGAFDSTCITIGENAQTQATNSIAIGTGIVATTANGLFVRHRVATATAVAGFIAGTNELVETSMPPGGVSSTDYAYAYDATAQLITLANTWYDVNFSGNVFLSNWTHVAGTAAFTCATTGTYSVRAQVTFDKTSANVETGIRLTLNGVEVPTSLQHYHMHTSATDHTFGVIEMPVNIAAGQILRVQIACDTGTTVSTSPGVGFWATQPSARLIITRFA